MSNGDRVVAESAEQTDIERLKELVRQYVVPFSVAAIVVLAVTGGWSAYRSHVRRVREEAAVKLSEARTAQELESIVADYPRSPSAPLALLRLAKLHYTVGAYEAAAAKYAEFGNRYPDHEMAPGAEIGRIYCLEAQGRLEEALASCERFVRAHPGHFLGPEALLVQARCLELLGRREEARVLYERIVSERAGSGWAKRAEEMLGTMEERERWRARRAATRPPLEGSQPSNLLSLTNQVPLSLAVSDSTGVMSRVEGLSE